MTDNRGKRQAFWFALYAAAVLGVGFGFPLPVGAHWSAWFAWGGLCFLAYKGAMVWGVDG